MPLEVAGDHDILRAQPEHERVPAERRVLVVVGQHVVEHRTRVLERARGLPHEPGEIDGVE